MNAAFCRFYPRLNQQQESDIFSVLFCKFCPSFPASDVSRTFLAVMLEKELPALDGFIEGVLPRRPAPLQSGSEKSSLTTGISIRASVI